MRAHCQGNGLLLAALIVTLIGLGVVLVRTLDVPREWATVLVGVALLGAGLARRALGGRDPS
jgi:hypothetical protein